MVASKSDGLLFAITALSIAVALGVVRGRNPIPYDTATGQLQKYFPGIQQFEIKQGPEI